MALRARSLDLVGPFNCLSNLYKSNVKHIRGKCGFMIGCGLRTAPLLRLLWQFEVRLFDIE